MDHSDIQELLGAYALNAVDAVEAALLEARVDGCSECTEELAQHREVAALLSATEKSAPAELWEDIVSQIPHASEEDQYLWLEAAETAPTEPADDAVMPLRRTWLRPMAAAAAVVLIAGVTVVQSARLGTVTNELAAERAKVASLSEQIDRAPLDIASRQALTASAGRRLLLGSEMNPSSAIIVLMPDGTGYLAEHTLEPLPTGRTYQLWAIVDGKVISAGILGADPAVVPFRIDPEGFAGFAITEEVAGGVEASQNDPVVVALDA